MVFTSSGGRREKDAYVEIQPLIFAKFYETSGKSTGGLHGGVVDVFTSALLLSGMLHVFFSQPIQQNILL